MGFAKVTYYRGYQIKTRVEPTHKPNPGFVGRVNVEADGVQIVTDTTQVMSNFTFAETTASRLGHEMVDIILSTQEPTAE